MVRERALIERSQTKILATMIGDYINLEANKGCSPEIFSSPVTIEPSYNSLYDLDQIRLQGHIQTPIFEKLNYLDKLTRLKVWISPDQPFDWGCAEIFIKQLQRLNHKICFELSGNEIEINFNLLCIESDLPTIVAAFHGIYQHCEITEVGYTDTPILIKNLNCNVQFRDYYTPPPYFHLFTNPIELIRSPLESLIISLSRIPKSAYGIYQVLFQAVDSSHNWHANVETLFDIEFSQKLNSGFQSMPQRYAQQGPAGDLKMMASDVVKKAHNDKPFFSTAVRCAIVGAENNALELLQSMSSILNRFQHGGRPINFLTNNDYKHILSNEQMFEMFLAGLTYRHGFLLNSMELTGLVHFPSITFTKLRKIPVVKLEVKPGTKTTTDTGTLIGTYSYAGEIHKVIIEEPARRSIHLIGVSGQGKTNAQSHLIMDDIVKGHGVAVIDPHGDLSGKILELIPEKYIEKTIYLEFGNSEYIPIWNPLKLNKGIDIGEATSDFLLAIKSFISPTGWGDRLEYILRHTIFSVFHLPQATILDVINILRRKPGHLEKFQNEILSIVDSQNTREFWLNDFKNFPKEAFNPPLNKLDKLMANLNISYMLSNPLNTLDFKKIMDEGYILIVNLSKLSLNIQGILGCFILSLLQFNTLLRSTAAKKFDIHIDETHRFVVSNALESFIEEGKKFNVTVSLAHQRNSQFDHKKNDAFDGVGASIIFKVNSRDASHFVRNMQGQVKSSDITGLEKYEAILRVGSEVHKIKTLEPLKIPKNNFRDKIIQQSHSRYYMHINDAENIIKRKRDNSLYNFQPSGFKQNGHLKNIKELPFDEF